MEMIRVTTRRFSVGAKIQLAISINVILAILIGEYLINDMLHFTGIFATLINLIINSIIAYFFGLVVSRAITQPLQLQVKMLEDMNTGRGDLTKRLDKNTNDEK